MFQKMCARTFRMSTPSHTNSLQGGSDSRPALWTTCHARSSMQNLSGRSCGGGTVTLFRTLDGVGEFAIAMHTRCGAWSALQGMLVRCMHASRSSRVAGLINKCSRRSLPSTHDFFSAEGGCDLLTATLGVCDMWLRVVYYRFSKHSVTDLEPSWASSLFRGTLGGRLQARGTC